MARAYPHAVRSSQPPLMSDFVILLAYRDAARRTPAYFLLEDNPTRSKGARVPMHFLLSRKNKIHHHFLIFLKLLEYA